MSALSRIKDGLRASVTDAQSRDAYRARLKWLVRGSGTIPAWSLEYRAGLAGRYAVDAQRSDPDAAQVRSCPGDCPTGAPLGHLYEQRFVYRLQDTIAHTVSGAALLCSTPEPPFFIRESISWPFESILSHGLDVPDPKDAQQTIKGPAAIFPSTNNYYHWLIEELPLIIRAQAREPGLTAVVNADSFNDRHATVTSALGIGIQRAPRTVRINNHVLPGRASDSWFIHPADAQILHELGERLSGTTNDGPTKIYISRRNASRSLPFEAELESRLLDRDFTILSPESLSWIDQIAVFRTARTVVAPHGAGLSNLVFTAPGATVVELTNGRHYNRCFEWLCHISEHTYQPIGAEDGTYRTTEQLLQAIIAAAED